MELCRQPNICHSQKEHQKSYCHPFGLFVVFRSAAKKQIAIFVLDFNVTSILRKSISRSFICPILRQFFQLYGYLDRLSVNNYIFRIRSMSKPVSLYDISEPSGIVLLSHPVNPQSSIAVANSATTHLLFLSSRCFNLLNIVHNLSFIHSA